MSDSQKPRGILFADVSGSTQLYEKIGDTEALRAVERCLNRIGRVVESYGGRVVKTIGDEIMAVFDSADQTFQAASEMQQRVEDLPPISGVKLSIRLGFQYGPTIEDKEDYFGDTVNIAARMAGLAKGRQILTSAETVEALTPLLQQATRALDALSVKGKDEDVHVFEVLWQEGADLTMKTQSMIKPPKQPKLILRHGGETLTLEAGKERAQLGRDAASDIVITDHRASRTHARIERRRDKFVLVDLSTNGTYVTFEGEMEISLKHEETILRGNGRISFGHAFNSDTREVVMFEVAE